MSRSVGSLPRAAIPARTGQSRSLQPGRDDAPKAHKPLCRPRPPGRGFTEYMVHREPLFRCGPDRAGPSQSPLQPGRDDAPKAHKPLCRPHPPGQSRSPPTRRDDLRVVRVHQASTKRPPSRVATEYMVHHVPLFRRGPDRAGPSQFPSPTRRDDAPKVHKPPCRPRRR